MGCKCCDTEIPNDGKPTGLSGVCNECNLFFRMVKRKFNSELKIEVTEIKIGKLIINN